MSNSFTWLYGNFYADFESSEQAEEFKEAINKMNSEDYWDISDLFCVDRIDGNTAIIDIHGSAPCNFVDAVEDLKDYLNGRTRCVEFTGHMVVIEDDQRIVHVGIEDSNVVEIDMEEFLKADTKKLSRAHVKLNLPYEEGEYVELMCHNCKELQPVSAEAYNMHRCDTTVRYIPPHDGIPGEAYVCWEDAYIEADFEYKCARCGEILAADCDDIAEKYEKEVKGE